MDYEYSVIICTRNRCDVLKRALEQHASLATNLCLRYEYVIVDNASTDATRDTVAYFATLINCPVQYVLEPREGHSIALNTGCQRARGAKLIFTDDDTLPQSTWFPSMHEMFVSKDADWVFGPVIPRWEYGPAPAWYGRETAMLVACLHFGDKVLMNDELPGCFVGANHACKRSKIFELGLYDPELGIRGDGLSHAGNDDILFRRACEAGLRVVYSPQSAVEHLIAPHRYDKRTHRKAFRMTGRNEFQVMLRTPPPYKRWLGVPRFYYSYMIKHFGCFVAASIKRNKPRAFFHETQFLRFGSIISAAFRERFFVYKTSA